MPYKSDAQRRYFNANREELEDQGVDVGEWNDSSRGKDLPERAKKKKKKRKKTASDVTLGTSQVHGMGLFAKDEFEADDVLALAAGRMRGNDAQSRYELTKAARYTNHSEDPSAQLVKVGEELYLAALRDIQPGEEILVDYSKTATVVGPGSYITYRGHTRATWDELEKQSDEGPMFTWDMEDVFTGAENSNNLYDFRSGPFLKQALENQPGLPAAKPFADSARASAALWGAGIGGLGGAALGAYMNKKKRLQGALLGGLAGLATGGATGYGLGAAYEGVARSSQQKAWDELKTEELLNVKKEYRDQLLAEVHEERKALLARVQKEYHLGGATPEEYTEALNKRRDAYTDAVNDAVKMKFTTPNVQGKRSKGISDFYAVTGEQQLSMADLVRPAYQPDLTLRNPPVNFRDVVYAARANRNKYKTPMFNTQVWEPRDLYRRGPVQFQHSKEHPGNVAYDFDRSGKPTELVGGYASHSNPHAAIQVGVDLKNLPGRSDTPRGFSDELSPNDQNILRHEMRHRYQLAWPRATTGERYYGKYVDSDMTNIAQSLVDKDKIKAPMGKEWSFSPSEIDAELSDLKQWWFQTTGKVINTPEEGIKALEHYAKLLDPESGLEMEVSKQDYDWQPKGLDDPRTLRKIFAGDFLEDEGRSGESLAQFKSEIARRRDYMRDHSRYDAQDPFGQLNEVGRQPVSRPTFKHWMEHPLWKKKLKAEFARRLTQLVQANTPATIDASKMAAWNKVLGMTTEKQAKDPGYNPWNWYKTWSEGRELDQHVADQKRRRAATPSTTADPPAVEGAPAEPGWRSQGVTEGSEFPRWGAAAGLGAAGLGLYGLSRWNAGEDEDDEEKIVKQALDPMISSGLGMAIPGALAGGVIGGARGAFSPGRQPINKRQAAVLRRSGVPEATVASLEAGEELSEDEENMLNEAGLDLDTSVPRRGRLQQALRSAGKGALIGGGIGGVFGAAMPEFERWRFKNTVKNAPHTVRLPQSVGGEDLARLTVDYRNHITPPSPTTQPWPSYSDMGPRQRRDVGKYVGNLWNRLPRADQYGIMKGMPGNNFAFESISKLPGRMWDTALGGLGIEKKNTDKTLLGETAKGLKGFANLISDKVDDSDEEKKKKDKEEKKLERAIARNTRERTARRIAKDRDVMGKYGNDIKISLDVGRAASGLDKLGVPAEFGALIAQRVSDFYKASVPLAPVQSHPAEIGPKKDQMLADVQNAKADPRLAGASRGLPALPASLQPQQQQQPGVGLMGNGPLTTGDPLTRYGLKERGGLDTSGTKIGAAPPELPGFETSSEPSQELYHEWRHPGGGESESSLNWRNNSLDSKVPYDSPEGKAHRLANLREYNKVKRNWGTAPGQGFNRPIIAHPDAPQTESMSPTDYDSLYDHIDPAFFMDRELQESGSTPPPLRRQLNPTPNQPWHSAPPSTRTPLPEQYEAQVSPPSTPTKDAAAKQAQGVNEREREFYRNRPGVAGVRDEQEKRRQQQLSLQAKRLEDAGYQPRADGKGWTKDQTLWAKPAPKPAPVAAAPATRWGKFTPDEFHKETDVYSKLKKKYAKDPAMLKHMYGTQGYKDWETAGKAYMNRNKPAAPVKPTAPATTVPKPPARPSPGSAFPPRRPPATPSTRSGAAVPAVPKTVTAAASPDLMQQLQHIVAEKEAEGAIKKPKYKAAPNSVTTVKRYPQREDKDDAVGSSTIKYINRKGRPYVRPKKK